MTAISTQNGAHIADQVLTTTISNELAPGLLRNDIDQRIIKIRPMATPLDQISRCAGAKAAKSLRVGYYIIDCKPVETTLADELAPTVEVSGPGTPTFQISVEDARIFSPSDTLLIPECKVEVDEAGTAEALTLYVADRPDDTTLTVVALNATRSGDSFNFDTVASGKTVIRMGRAAAELDVQSHQFAALPKKSFNNCQIFKMQIEQSTFQKLAHKEVNWNFSDQEEAAISDMRLGMEKNFLFGHNCVITDPVKGEEIYFTGGIWNQTTHDFPYKSSDVFDQNWLIKLTRHAFTGAAAGSPRKILIAGSGLIEKLSNIPVSKAIAAGETLVRYGIEFREIRTNFGTLYCVTSEIFDQCGRPYDGIIIDPDCLTKYVHVPFRADTLDLRSSGQRNSDAVVLTEASCMVLRHPHAHTRIICQDL